MEQLRMDRHTFTTSCSILRTNGKLKDSRYVDVKEIVCIIFTYSCTSCKKSSSKISILKV